MKSIHQCQIRVVTLSMTILLYEKDTSVCFIMWKFKYRLASFYSN